MTAWNTKKVESTNLRSHGICVVGRLPKVTDAHGKRFPCTERLTSARGSLPKEFHSDKIDSGGWQKGEPAGVLIQVRDALRPSIHYHPPSHAAGGT
jgi:hypothetical protein